MRATYSVAVPFPNDCAPFKVIRRCDCDRTSIVGAAQTREAAEAKARRLNDLEERLVIDHAAQFDAAELQEEERRDNKAALYIDEFGKGDFAKYAAEYNGQQQSNAERVDASTKRVLAALHHWTLHAGENLAKDLIAASNEIKRLAALKRIEADK